ncbi:hypothetical protein [Streptomyces virginiae]|uniref:hypothetical protein n=1 Tax=Streptomyces virginiae TaxID=1961 RepID=UPI0034523078
MAQINGMTDNIRSWPYAATAVFVRGEDEELQPGRPPSADHLSVLLEETSVREDGPRVCKVDFLVRDLATPHLVPGGEILVMEGLGSWHRLSSPPCASALECPGPGSSDAAQRTIENRRREGHQ